MVDSIQLRRKVHSLEFDEFFTFCEQYKHDLKVYAFCCYVFLEKLKKNKDIEQQLKFLKACIDNDISEKAIIIMKKMIGVDKCHLL